MKIPHNFAQIRAKRLAKAHTVKVESKGKVHAIEVVVPVKWCVHVQLGDQFEDVYVEAATERTAIAEAKLITKLDARWASFTVEELS